MKSYLLNIFKLINKILILLKINKKGKVIKSIF